MEMQQLRYVVAVARSGNFSHAAGQCRVAQPSPSFAAATPEPSADVDKSAPPFTCASDTGLIAVSGSHELKTLHSTHY